MKINNTFIKKAKKRLLRMHYESGVGHIGGNLSCIDTMLIIFNEFLKKNDDFILSKGHAAGSLYIALWSIGKLSEKDLKTFHKNLTHLAAHPSSQSIPDIPFSTGSLGHGLSLAAGNALANNFLKNNYKTYCLLSDGEFQEGSIWEALIFISHHRLNNVTLLIDCNKLQGFGTTSEVASMSSLRKKLESFKFNIQEIDGHKISEIRNALNKDSSAPKIIILNTIKGHGISFMENKMQWHYLPLDDKLYSLAIEELN